MEECQRNGYVNAKYVKSSNKLFNGNPFIEALPKPREGKELTMSYYKAIPAVPLESFDKMTLNEKKATVFCLNELRLPLSFQKQLEFINYRVITDSYMLRKLYTSTPLIFDDTKNLSKNKSFKLKGKIEDAAPSGFSLLGYSGCGKSSSLKQLLDNIPQLIMHHPDPATTIPQITYIVVSCVPNSNFSALYAQIGEAIDFALGNDTPIYESIIKKCKSLADKQLKICELIEIFSIGTIILDEIQLIDFSANKENSYEGLLSIVNRTKIALSVVGTDDAYLNLFSNLRNARRSGYYIGASDYSNDKNYFNKLTKMLFKWQWFDKPIEWSQELSNTLYDCSRGLINQLIGIYSYMMLDYLDLKEMGKSPTINSEFIHNVNKKHFKQLKEPMDYVKQTQLREEYEKSINKAIIENNKYKMEDLDTEQVKKDSEILSQVLTIIKSSYPEYSNDDISIAVNNVLRQIIDEQVPLLEIVNLTMNVLQGKHVTVKKRTKTKELKKKNILDVFNEVEAK